jgi:hypothetical protein
MARERYWGRPSKPRLQRFARRERQGKRCVLLYCGDHDPGGFQISLNLRKNFSDLTPSVGWSPEHLDIQRFGLNYDFIEEHVGSTTSKHRAASIRLMTRVIRITTNYMCKAIYSVMVRESARQTPWL